MQTQQFSTTMFLSIRAKARRYFFSERINFGRNPSITEILDYLKYYYSEDSLPTIATVTRWQTSWKRSN